MKKLFIAVTLITAPFAASAQATFANNAPSVTNYLGFDPAISVIELPIVNGNGAIGFYTQPTGVLTPQRRLWIGINGRLWLNLPIALPETTFGIRPRSSIGLNIVAPGTLDNPAPSVISAQFAPDLGTFTNIGALANINSASPSLANQGFRAFVRGATKFNIAVRAIAQDASSGDLEYANIGVLGTALETGVGSKAVNYGVRGEACGGDINIAVYGAKVPLADPDVVCGSGVPSQNYAGYFAGPLISGTEINPSDQNLKTNIEPIANATALLNQIVPKTYYFNIEEFGFMGLPENKQYGLISQEVEQVLPDVVIDYVHPAQFGLDGETVSPQVEVKGMAYKQFIPLLIAAFNEQSTLLNAKSDQVTELQSEVEDLQSQLQQMQQQMASMLTVVQAMQAKTNNCCNDGSSGSLTTPAGTTEGVKLLQNTPNPFDTHTRVDFTLPTDAYVVLELSDAHGRPLRRLVDGQMNAGPQSIMLDGSSLAPGMYFYTVYANGEFITKKMVKR